MPADYSRICWRLSQASEAVRDRLVAKRGEDHVTVENLTGEEPTLDLKLPVSGQSPQSGGPRGVQGPDDGPTLEFRPRQGQHGEEDGYFAETRPIVTPPETRRPGASGTKTGTGGLGSPPISPLHGPTERRIAISPEGRALVREMLGGVTGSATLEWPERNLI